MAKALLFILACFVLGNGHWFIALLMLVCLSAVKERFE